MDSELLLVNNFALLTSPFNCFHIHSNGCYTDCIFKDTKALSDVLEDTGSVNWTIVS